MAPTEARDYSRPPALAGVALTTRDLAIFGDLYRLRIVGVPWLARHHFRGSEPAAWVRLRRLVRAGYIDRLPAQRNVHRGHRLTSKGRRVIGIARRVNTPTKAWGSDFHAVHTMLLTELMDGVLADCAPLAAQGWSSRWITEQELWEPEHEPWFPRALGVVPDGVLELTKDRVTQRLAVELERHVKRPDKYATKLPRYRQLLDQGVITRVRWYVTHPTVGNAVRRALRAARFADDDRRVEVRPLPEGITVYGSARAA